MITDTISDIRLVVTIVATIALPMLTAILGWVVSMERRLSRLEGKIDVICSKMTGLFKKIEKERV